MALSAPLRLDPMKKKMPYSENNGYLGRNASASALTPKKKEPQFKAPDIRIWIDERD